MIQQDSNRRHQESADFRKSSASFRGSAFSTLFIWTALLLMLLPFITTFNSFLTSLFLRFHYYRVLEEFIVPYQSKALASVLSILPIPITVYPVPKGVWFNGLFIEMQWNCLGWQSAVLLIATFLTGIQGKFTGISRVETMIIGFLGTYLINMLRLVVVILLMLFFGRTGAVLFHDFFSLVFVILWFFVFWWFSYSFVLETKDAD